VEVRLLLLLRGDVISGDALVEQLVAPPLPPLPPPVLPRQARLLVVVQVFVCQLLLVHHLAWPQRILVAALFDNLVLVIPVGRSAN
jgi:hypothetical protein